MSKYGVLIVDDSAFMRKAISLLFELDSDFFIAGIARNGQEAIEKIKTGFTKPLADRFNNLCELEVREAEDGDILRAGTAYIAPAGFQTILEKKPNGEVCLRIRSDLAPHALYKPSIDVALTSAAPVFGKHLVTAILTGMGVDGTIGCSDVKQLKGRVVVEAEESCVVYGMPKSVYEAGLADRQVALPQIYANLLDLAFE